MLHFFRLSFSKKISVVFPVFVLVHPEVSTRRKNLLASTKSEAGNEKENKKIAEIKLKFNFCENERARKKFLISFSSFLIRPQSVSRVSIKF